MTGQPDRPALHEFVPYVVRWAKPWGHVCGDDCSCQVCGIPKGDREVHYQARDRRRPKLPAGVETR